MTMDCPLDLRRTDRGASLVFRPADIDGNGVATEGHHVTADGKHGLDRGAEHAVNGDGRELGADPAMTFEPFRERGESDDVEDRKRSVLAPRRSVCGVSRSAGNELRQTQR